MKVETAALGALIVRLKVRFADGQQAIRENFLADSDSSRLWRERSRLIDDTLAELCCEFPLPPTLTVVAVGGHGRGELYPASNIDLLILLPEAPGSLLSERIEKLVCLFRDIGRKIGHGVRTVEQCLAEASRAITVLTALIEARLLVGSGCFQHAHELLDVVREEIFEATATAILETFLLLQQHPELKGLSARTQGTLWRARHGIDSDFRIDPRHAARLCARHFHAARHRRPQRRPPDAQLCRARAAAALASTVAARAACQGSGVASGQAFPNAAASQPTTPGQSGSR